MGARLIARIVARLGLAGLGPAWRGAAGRGEERGGAWLGVAWHGLARRGTRRGVAW